MYIVECLINGNITKKYRYPTQKRIIAHAQNIFNSPSVFSLLVTDKQGRIWFGDSKEKMSK
jgi:hypothetical protein